MQTVHATAVAWHGWGVLLRGLSGSGKSDLALRLIDCGAKLVADDRVVIRQNQGHILLSAPAALHGMLEVRGVGLYRFDVAQDVPLAVVIDLVARADVERLPPDRVEYFQDVAVPLYRLPAFDTSTPAKINQILTGLRVAC